MNNEIIQMNVDHGTAHVTLNRPDVHNAFDEVMIAALAATWDELAGRDDVRVVIVRGTGRSFSAGADLNWMKRAAGYSEEQNREDALKLAQMLYKLYVLPKLTIACVQGAALGGGMGLVSCCDIVIAEEKAVFGLSEVKLGLIPATIAPYVLRALGERQARRYFQTGERFTARKAYEIGFIHELAPGPEEADARLTGLLHELERNGPHAMAEAKKLCLDLAGQDIGQALLEDTAQRIAQIRTGNEAKEGLAAFLEKRKPDWVKNER